MTRNEKHAWQHLDQYVTDALPYLHDQQITSICLDVMRTVEHHKATLMAARLMPVHSHQRADLRRQSRRLKIIASRHALTLQNATQIHKYQTACGEAVIRPQQPQPQIQKPCMSA